MKGLEAVLLVALLLLVIATVSTQGNNENCAPGTARMTNAEGDFTLTWTVDALGCDVTFELSTNVPCNTWIGVAFRCNDTDDESDDTDDILVNDDDTVVFNGKKESDIFHPVDEPTAPADVVIGGECFTIEDGHQKIDNKHLLRDQRKNVDLLCTKRDDDGDRLTIKFKRPIDSPDNVEDVDLNKCVEVHWARGGMVNDDIPHGAATESGIFEKELCVCDPKPPAAGGAEIQGFTGSQATDSATGVYVLPVLATLLIAIVLNVAV